MPELPEVETIRRGLVAELAGRRIERVELLGSRLRRPLQRGLAAALRGRTVVGIDRRGKYLLARLDDGKVWLMHLGMTGRISISTAGAGADGHVHLKAKLDDGRQLLFRDPRRFGLILVSKPDGIAELALLGAEPLSAVYTADYLHQRCRRSRRTIKDLLMDQKVVAGLGNIYVNEILFAAGLRPGRRAHRVTLRQAYRLVEATREVLSRALRAGGSSISDFRNTEGKPGRFQEQFFVYGREGRNCLVCGEKVRRRLLGGRSSFYCRCCQR